MTRGQRRAHAVVFRVLALTLFVSLGFALWRRHVVTTTEPASLGRTPLHDGAAP